MFLIGRAEEIKPRVEILGTKVSEDLIAHGGEAFKFGDHLNSDPFTVCSGSKYGFKFTVSSSQLATLPKSAPIVTAESEQHQRFQWLGRLK